MSSNSETLQQEMAALRLQYHESHLATPNNNKSDGDGVGSKDEINGRSGSDIREGKRWFRCSNDQSISRKRN
jgi:hypothetical protein